LTVEETDSPWHGFNILHNFLYHNKHNYIKIQNGGRGWPQFSVPWFKVFLHLMFHFTIQSQ
jgi:hypothetical protein